jgi:ATP-binding cassette subfamily B protein
MSSVVDGGAESLDGAPLPPVGSIGAAAIDADRAARGAEARRMAWRIAKREPVAYAICWVEWVLFHTLPVATGLALKGVLDNLPAEDGDVVWLALAALAGVELGRWVLFLFNVVQWHGCFVFWTSLPRVNILRSLLGARGPVAGRLPGSPGEAVSRFRDDTHNVGMVLDVWVDISGSVVATLVALVAMVRVDARVTVFVTIPVLVALWVCRWLGARLRVWRRREREATAAVTGFIGDTFGAIGTVKSSGARAAVARRFAALGDARADAARVDQVATQSLQSVSDCVGHLGTGLILLMLVPALARGDATVGDVGLYTTSVIVVSWLPRWAARYSATLRQADVSVERLAELLPEPDPAGLTAPAPVPLRHGPGPYVATPAGAGPADRLERLEVRGLSVAYGDAHRSPPDDQAGTDRADRNGRAGDRHLAGGAAQDGRARTTATAPRATDGAGDHAGARAATTGATAAGHPGIPTTATAPRATDGTDNDVGHITGTPARPHVEGRDEAGAAAPGIHGVEGRDEAGAAAPGIHGVDLVVERGTMTVVTGPVGSGKSTLLRAVLGLVGRRGGEVLWNGEPLDDPGRALVPPRAAYVAQAPRLFSEPLSDAILLGVDRAGLDEAVRLACLDEDVERMPDGLATVVGARGVRLSGGQAQRTAAARAFVRGPELLVIDDLSSALDVQTEARMWSQLLDAGRRDETAFLVVSHRPAVLERADRVVVLADGRITS